MLNRIRLTVAAAVVLASLLAVSAWFKNATCDCGAGGLRWDTIALASTIVAGVAITTYAALSLMVRRNR